MDRGTGVGGGDRRAEAVRLLGIAEQLLDARDLARSRSFAELAMEVEPLLDGADRVLAVADVLLAAQRRRVNNHVDWYAVLQLEASPGARSASAVRLQYRRLALLLHPDRRGVDRSFRSSFPSSSAAADEAFKLVSEAWAVLSDPAKKELYDKEIDMASAAETRPGENRGGGQHGEGDHRKKASVEAEVGADSAFWTACTSCCYVYQYARGYEGRALLCQNCQRAFQATEMASPPPVVPGKDMYFCSWGLFPLGFPGGPNFVWPVVPNSANGRDAAGEPGRQSSFQGFPWQWGAHGPLPAVDGNGELKSVGRKRNQRSSTARKGKANGAASAYRQSPGKTRRQVMAKGQEQPVADAKERGVEASGDVVMDVGPANKDSVEIGREVETKPDGMKNPQKAGSSRTVEVSMEDLNLNFAIDVNAAAAIIESMDAEITEAKAILEGLRSEVREQTSPIAERCTSYYINHPKQGCPALELQAHSCIMYRYISRQPFNFLIFYPKEM